MKRLGLSILIAFYTLSCFAQLDSLYKLENRIMAGDKDALVRLAPYLDNQQIIIEPLGYHRLQHSVRSIATRILQENCLFSQDELDIDTTLTSSSFLKFLDTHNDLFFDDTTGEFLLTPLSVRNTTFETRALSSQAIKELDSNMLYTPYPDWVYADRIIKPLADRDPVALLKIAAALYKTRARYDRYYFRQDEYFSLIKNLTHIEIGVPDEDGHITFLYQPPYRTGDKLNYLIYWTRHYKDYRWDSTKRLFLNTGNAPRRRTLAEELLDLMNSENDSIALDAFARLAELDTSQSQAAMADYQAADTRFNYSLPIFPFRFLQVINMLVHYCRSHHISYLPSGDLRTTLEKLLDRHLPFSKRYQLEDTLIHRLTLDQITQVEYFGLLHENSWNATYSIGRIIDKFYSRNWTPLLQNSAALEWYLKKSRIFNDLGIIGNCNKYLKKFSNSSENTLWQIKAISQSTIDPDVSLQADTIIKLYSVPITPDFRDKKYFEGNADYTISDLKKEFDEALHDAKKSEFAISAVISKISYDQIGQVLDLMKKDSLLGKNIYNFLERDFGLPITAHDTAAQRLFREDYSHLDEYHLYEKYLRRLNPAYYFDKEHSDFHRIYDILKYDVVDAFTGGGGSRREDGIYMLIKLLELHFNTRLGFPKKLCNAAGIWGCNCTDRAKYWMHYLEQEGLVQPDKNEPVSIAP
ncbi:MAG TPA: hypothetical protein VHD83_16110 [Puia sp.]|nr:hypothetical protein [Puia sp.]